MSDQIKREPRTWQFGLALFAGIMMVVVGVFDAVQGLAALFNNNVFLATPNYLFAFDLTAWGWIHLLMGLVLIAVGILVVTGKAVGRIAGVVVVFISAVENFASLPYYPVWSMVLIALDIIVIWALVTYSTKPEVV